MKPELPSLLLEPEAAAYLRITSEQLAKIRRRREIAFIKISGHKIRYTKQHLDEYVLRCQQQILENRTYSLSDTIGSRRARGRKIYTSAGTTIEPAKLSAKAQALKKFEKRKTSSSLPAPQN